MLITHGTVVTFDTPNAVIDDGAVMIEGDSIVAVGTTEDLVARHPDAETLDVGGRLVMPGNICAHTHFYGAYARGLAIPGPAPKDFPEILARLWWQLDKALTPEDVYYSAMVCLVDAVRRGTTTLFDHHASPNAIGGSLDIIAGAVQEAGLRACLCYEVTDRDGPGRCEAGIVENARFIERVRQQGGTQLGALFGLHAALTLSDETLDRCAAAAAEGVGFHIHAAEGPADQELSLSRYDMRVIHRLNARGILGPRTIVAHAIAIDPWEMEALRDTETWVSHQPRSNMNNAVGVADVPSMLRAGMKVVLGNDGFSNDMFQEMKVAYLLHKSHRGDPRVMGGYEVMTMAMANNARLAGSIFGEGRLGRLAEGAFADIIVLDYYPFTPLTAGNVPWHIVFGIDGSNVTHTIAGGRLLMKERELLCLDEKEIMAKALERAPGVWERFAAVV
ncbi:MAG: putative aminohydrolase SsnA [Anaerolineae bacterium]